MSEAVEYAQKALVAISHAGNWGDGGIDSRVVTQAEDALEALIAEHERVLAELAEAHTHFAIQEGRIRESLDRAHAAEARLSAPRTEAEVDAAVKAHWAPRLHVNDTWHDRCIDMRFALDAADKVRRERAQGGSGE